jgi:serine-type D-Ala-D-Ala carboxypeptidase/endopeptidase
MVIYGLFDSGFIKPNINLYVKTFLEQLSAPVGLDTLCISDGNACSSIRSMVCFKRYQDHTNWRFSPMRHLRRSLSIALTLFAALQPLVFGQSIQDEAEVKKILQQRIDVDKKGVGIAVGILNEKGIKLINYGRMNVKESREVTADSLFEIGSITKVFTGILLADMVARGEMKLDDPISLYLPKSVKVPSRNGREITLLDLATHTSGLPRMPSNFKPKDPENPFADYTEQQLYEFLSGYTLPRDIGSLYEYSNIGMGLLGHLLALKAKTDYETLVLNRIGKPLKMNDTRITLSAEQKARLASGHSADFQPVPNWDIGVLAGAGALRSTVNDMLKFLAANLGLVKTALLPVLQKSHEVPKLTHPQQTVVALGWHIQKSYGTEIIWHNGGTGGYRTFIGFAPAKRAAVVVLSNSSIGQDDIGVHILESQSALQKFTPTKPRAEIPVAAEILQTYVGEYQLAPKTFISVTREDDKLFAQVTDQSKFRVFAESQSKFFYRVVDAQISFVKDDKGQVTQLILHQGGQNIPGKKIK